MNTQLKQRIGEKLEKLSEQHVAEVLDFVEFLENREQVNSLQPINMDKAQSRLHQLVPPLHNHLSPPYLDTTGFKFNREEANER